MGFTNFFTSTFSIDFTMQTLGETKVGLGSPGRNEVSFDFW